jgi:hypothetical protein
MKAANKKDKYEKILEKKLSTPVDVLTKGFPSEFATYLTYCRALRFEDKPDYGYLRNLLKDLFIRSGYEYDYVYDWDIIPKGERPVEEEKSTKEVANPATQVSNQPTGTQVNLQEPTKPKVIIERGKTPEEKRNSTAKLPAAEKPQPRASITQGTAKNDVPTGIPGPKIAITRPR